MDGFSSRSETYFVTLTVNLLLDWHGASKYVSISDWEWFQLASKWIVKLTCLTALD